MEPLGNYVVDLNPKASGGLFKPDPHPKKIRIQILLKITTKSRKSYVKQLKEKKMHDFSKAKLFFCFTGSGIHMMKAV
jgi:hypothetical protein